MNMRLDFETVLSPLVVNEAANLKVTDVKQLLDDGIKAAQSGDRVAARAFLLDAVEVDQRCELAWLWLASISEYPEELLAFLNNVLDINPANQRAIDWSAATRSLLARTYVQRGIDASKSDQKDFAAQCFEKALSYDEKNQMAWLWLASLSPSDEEKLELLERASQIDQKNEAVQSALRVARQKHADAMLARARSSFVTGDRQKADEVLAQLVERYPNNEEAWMLRSQVAEDFAAKTAAFERVLEINPDNVAARAGLDSLVPAVVVEEVPEQQETEPAKVESRIFGGDFVEDDHPTQELEFPKAMIDEYALTPSPISAPEPDSLPDVTGYFDRAELAFDDPVTELPSSVFAGDVEPWVPVSEKDTAADSDVLDHPEEIPYSEAVEWDTAASSIDENHEVQGEAEKSERLSPVAVCPFCSHENSPHAVRCDGCLAVLTLSDIEMLLSNRDCRTDIVRRVTEQMDAERQLRGLHEDEMVTLGIGYLNLKDFDAGFAVLKDASNASPNSVVLASQVNSLAIRLEEIKDQNASNASAPRGKSILVVDDSITVRKLISGKLEKSGHDVLCASDGEEAIKALERFAPDLVLLDIDMPKMDGYQVCKLIRGRASTKDIPVIMISGKDGFFDKVRGKMAGATDHISKPFGPETLMKALENYLSAVPQP
jgi:twitching motility two-component system response regulator PilG